MFVLRDDPTELAPYIQEEILLQVPLGRGSKGGGAKRVQEWLNLHDIGLVVDGDYGPVTERCVEQFQQSLDLPRTGVVDLDTWSRLSAPMVEALRSPMSASLPLGDAFVQTATNHVQQHPEEVGGDNCGPWVRLYMDGRDGKARRWCAGFVTFVMKQACEAMEATPPIRGTFSCDAMARQGKDAGLFLAEDSVTEDKLRPGSIFLIRKTPDDWVHAGFVTSASDSSFSTIEGNANDDGSANGVEVCIRTRGLKKTDFIVFD